MDSFTVRAVKAKAIKKQRKIQNVTNMLRLVEILVVLAVLSRISVQLPVSLKGSGDYIKDFLLVLVSPRFVFVVGNVIVIVLFAKSGHLPGSTGKKSDLYEQFVKMSGKTTQENRGKQREKLEAVARVSENRVKPSDKLESIVKEESSVSATSMIVKSYERSRSENLTSYRRPEKELRRSATENLTKKKKKNSGSDKFPEDNLSSEEFKSTIEAFIERQKRFRRDEENSVIV